MANPILRTFETIYFMNDILFQMYDTATDTNNRNEYEHTTTIYNKPQQSIYI
jgi:hypothetical protein